MQSSQVFRISLHGLDQKMLARMRTVFKINFKNNAVVSDEAFADVSVFDGDNPDILPALQCLWSRYPRRRVVYLASADLQINDAHFIEKPGKLDEIWEAIVRCRALGSLADNEPSAEASQPGHFAVAAALSEKSVSDGHPIRSNNKTSTGDFYDPEKFLQGFIAKTMAVYRDSRQFVKIQCWNGKRLLYHAAQNEFFTDLSDIQLKHLGIMQMSSAFEVAVSPIPQNEFFEAALAPYIKSHNGDVFLWNVALNTARGRLPRGINPNAAVSIKQWPNVTRVHCPIDFLRITATLARKSQSCHDVANSLNIPLTDVFSFFSTAYACGIAEISKRQSEPTHSTKDETHVKRGLFNSLLRKLIHQGAKRHA